MRIGLRIAVVLLALGLVVVSIVAAFLAFRPSSLPAAGEQPPPPPPPPPSPNPSACPNSVGLCLETNVTRVVDGDTLDVETGLAIRLVLVDAPELSESGGPPARDYLTSLCSGKPALVDEDDWQIGADPYGRVLAVVYCDGTNANAAMIASGYAQTYYAFCAASEFGSAAWSGCSTPPPPGDCDPSYPDVCIPPPPPDLDCVDIPYRNFRVLPPDPHNFDGDHDGIGCET